MAIFTYCISGRMCYTIIREREKHRKENKMFYEMNEINWIEAQEAQAWAEAHEGEWEEVE